MKILAFGEVLFDVYPAFRTLGGAPLNFCAHLSQLGEEGYMYSAVGTDEAGQEVLRQAESYGVNTRYLTQDENYPTGACFVTRREGEPVYDLTQISAYDHIGIDDRIRGESFDVLYFGTLAQRGEVSRNTLCFLRETLNCDTVFFDMNLRQNYYSAQLVEEGLFAADMVKMNREEFLYVKEISLCSESDEEAALAYLCNKYHIRVAILTKDKDGACVYEVETGCFRAGCVPGEFVSAVGAGDSFCACFLHHYLRGASLPVALEKASILAGFVVSREEAIPRYPDWLRKAVL